MLGLYGQISKMNDPTHHHASNVYCGNNNNNNNRQFTMLRLQKRTAAHDNVRVYTLG
jgi:hypothetical protein